MSAGDRASYSVMAESDKERYRTELEEFNSAMLSSGQQHRVIIPRVNNCKSRSISISSKSGTTSSSTSSAATTVTEWEEGSDGTGVNTATSVVTSPEEIYRPRTAYSHFSRQEKQFVAALAGDTKMQHVTGKYFSARWSFMSPDQKRLYSLLEEDDRAEAQRLHMSKCSKT